MKKSSSRLPALAASALLFILSACGGGNRGPAPFSTLPPAGLEGQRIVVLPVQRIGEVEGDAEAEMVFALRARMGSGNWTFPAEVRRSLSRSPGLYAPVDDLPVEMFFRAEVERVGDPLYGILRRVAAVTDATGALIPLAVTFREASEATGDAPARTPAVEVTVALVNILNGRVVLMDVVEGTATGAGDPGGLARAMEALAARLLPAG